MISSLRTDRRGFTLIEVLGVVLILGIIAVVSITVVPDTINESRFNRTTEMMKQISDAMIGSPELRDGTAKAGFGYLGDVGALPSSLPDLLTKPAGIAAYAMSSTARFGAGWNGPYLTATVASTGFLNDFWGNALVYAPAAVPPTLTSYGADGVAGGTGFNQDITVEFPTTQTSATVSGFVCVAGGPYTGSAQVVLNAPDGSGNLAQTVVNVAPADKGFFSFSNVSMGVRSIAVYVPTQAAPDQTLGPVLITVGQPQTAVPCKQLDLTP